MGLRNTNKNDVLHPTPHLLNAIYWLYTHHNISYKVASDAEGDFLSGKYK